MNKIWSHKTRLVIDLGQIWVKLNRLNSKLVSKYFFATSLRDMEWSLQGKNSKVRGEASALVVVAVVILVKLLTILSW